MPPPRCSRLTHLRRANHYCETSSIRPRTLQPAQRPPRANPTTKLRANATGCRQYSKALCLADLTKRLLNTCPADLTDRLAGDDFDGDLTPRVCADNLVEVL